MMSSNLVIAFATTVVGLLVGTLAVALLSIKKGWYQSDAMLVSFAAGRLPQLSEATDREPHSHRHTSCACMRAAMPEEVGVGSGGDGDGEKPAEN
jgi:hypothetical protein